MSFGSAAAADARASSIVSGVEELMKARYAAFLTPFTALVMRPFLPKPSGHSPPLLSLFSSPLDDDDDDDDDAVVSSVDVARRRARSIARVVVDRRPTTEVFRCDRSDEGDDDDDDDDDARRRGDAAADAAGVAAHARIVFEGARGGECGSARRGPGVTDARARDAGETVKSTVSIERDSSQSARVDGFRSLSADLFSPCARFETSTATPVI
jgi:hypothetical protein